MTDTIHTIEFTASVNMEEITGRIDELRADRESHEEEFEGVEDAPEWADADELEDLESIAAELEGMGGGHKWNGNWYPINLIHESNFESEMDEMVADCYPELSDNLPSWVSLSIEYDTLKQDYTEHEFDGNTFYVR